MAGEVFKIFDDILTDKDISQIRSNVATVKALGEMCDNVTVTLAAHCERLLFARETLMTCNLKAAVLRGQDRERIAELESRFLPRCEVCGYNRDDAALHCDHHLCSGEIPETPETLRAEAAEREAEECRKLESECENMAMMIRRMSWQLAKYKPDATVLKQAKGYLEKIGRQGNILRDET